MLEVKFTGRGGQGVSTALKVLAMANFELGRCVQCFASYGGERRGAPVEGYLRIDESSIEARGHDMTPAVLLIFHPSLYNPEVLSGLKKGAFILVNTAGESIGKPSSNISAELRSFDATAIAVSAGLGSPSNPIVGPSMLGGLCALMPKIAPEKELVAAMGRISQNGDRKSLSAFSAAYREAGRIKSGVMKTRERLQEGGSLWTN